MVAPIIPGLNSHEIPAVIEAAAEAGAINAGYTIVRLNGALQPIFKDWLRHNYPDRANKVLAHIAECHGGQLSDSRFGARMAGQGQYAEQIAQLVHLAKKRHMDGGRSAPYNNSAFRRQPGPQLFE
jgi:DNA repair photolyase